MQTKITSRYADTPATLTASIEERLTKLAERYRFLQQGFATVGQENKTHACEIAVHTRHQIIRAKERDADPGTAADRAFDKIERQLGRHKGRLLAHGRTGDEQAADTTPLSAILADGGDEEYEPPRVVKVKRIAIKPMAVDEAVLQMDLLGHDFYVFVNDQDSEVNVIYRRASGENGLIQPE